MKNQHTGFFITGTDTEVGKTLVSGAIILKLREHGLKTLGFKPVVAGTYQDAAGNTLNEDLETLRIAAQLEPGDFNLSPYILPMPVAPHLAAATLNQGLELEKIKSAYDHICTEAQAVVVEGAGGFLVPLNESEDLSDLARDIQLPVILVVGMRLGCINHALLTYQAIESRHLKVAGWIANSLATEMPLLKENIASLEARIHAPLLGIIPPLPKALQKPNHAPYSIAALEFAAQHLSLPSA